MRELRDDECYRIAKNVGQRYGIAWDEVGPMLCDQVRAGYRAAQAAMPPREPTPEMVAAGTAAHSRSPVFEAQRIIDIWYAMHDAHTFAEDSARYYGFPPDDAGPLDHQPCIERGCPNPSLMPASEYCAYHARREPQAAADGPAADHPIAELCERLTAAARDERLSTGALYAEAADALERQAREIVAANARCVQFAARWEEQEERALREKERAERAEAERDALRECVKAADVVRVECTRDSGPSYHDRLLDAVVAYDRARAKVKP